MSTKEMSFSSLTPKQREIELIIKDCRIKGVMADSLRCMSEMTEEFKSSQHYHDSPYIQHLIQQSENILLKLSIEKP